jgi:hypothetical protein
MSLALEVAEVFCGRANPYRQAHAEHRGASSARHERSTRRWAQNPASARAVEGLPFGWSLAKPATIGAVQSSKARPAPNCSPSGRPNCFRCLTSMSFFIVPAALSELLEMPTGNFSGYFGEFRKWGLDGQPASACGHYILERHRQIRAPAGAALAIC